MSALAVRCLCKASRAALAACSRQLHSSAAPEGLSIRGCLPLQSLCHEGGRQSSSA